MTDLRKEAALFEQTIPDGFGGYINQRAVSLTPTLYPDCPLCMLDIVRCDCPGDDAAEAMWRYFQDQKGKSEL